MPNQVRWREDGDSIQTTSTSYEYDRSSYDSARSYSTAQTAYSTKKPPLQRFDTCFGRVESNETDYPFDTYDERRISVETYASTEPSEMDFSDDDAPAYEILDFPDEQYQSDAIPATPRDFSDLFPSSRRLSIHHDDSTLDGNMNLRVDTQVETDWSSRKQNLTLFHLKMNDLKSREFSLRRYCRDSGREVCHSIRKYQTPSEKRPALTKSFSSALTHFKKHSDSKGPHLSHLQRNDSGYGSIFQEAFDDMSVKAPKENKKSSRLPTNTIKLEFSNYAQVEIKRRGTGSKKGYQFEYWGHSYTWKRSIRQEGDFEEVSYHLLRDDRSAPLAHIVPVPLTRSQAEEERLKGGFIAPCSMWIKDQEIIDGLPDIADVIVSTGLMAIVDDAIKRRWSSSKRQVLLPLIRNMNMEYIGPKRLIDEVFNRRPKSHLSPTHRPTTW